MSKASFRLVVDDVSTFSRALRGQLQDREGLPGHVEMLNIVSRAAGYRNYQHFRATAENGGTAPPAGTEVIPPASEARAASMVDASKIAKVARYFGGDGRLTSWPARTGHQQLAMWVLWSRMPAREQFSEIEISELLDEWHAFGDRALLRRSLIDHKLVERTKDGRAYWRVERAPPAEFAPLLRAISGRSGPAAAA